MIKDADENNLLVAHINWRSLINTFDDLKYYDITNQNFDILGLSEASLNNNISNASVRVSGYKLVRKDREGSRGGVVTVYVKSGLHFTVLDVAEVKNGLEQYYG